jgi:isopentenyl diphosphate isomerase/L-lactate dehydrogenase-like FMN-dependent dehydrogenase
MTVDTAAVPRVAERLNVDEFEHAARARLPRAVFDFIAGGACDERTVDDNRRAFERLCFRPRVLAGVTDVDTSVQILGCRSRSPILLAPTALNQLVHPDGEVAVVRAAAATVTVVSCVASCPVEQIASAAEGPLWFQLYLYRDRSVSAALLRRAEAAGCRAVVLTVDTPRLGYRERDLRNRWITAASLTVGERSGVRSTTAAGPRIDELLDPSAAWNVISWLRSLTRLPIVLKGILTAEDAAAAIEHGVDGIIVSNHGGRQLDGAIAAVAALPDVAREVGRRIPVLMDGGVRRGTDVIAALALGADAVLIGRPYLWGLAVAGEDGVRRVLELLDGELRLGMLLMGMRSLESISPACLAISEQWPPLQPPAECR